MASNVNYRTNSTDFGKLEDIRAFLQGRFNIRMSLDDLKNANPEVVVKIYLAFLTAFNFRTENLNQLPFGSQIPDPELLQDIMPYAILVQMITKFLKTMGSNINFYLGDLIDPKPKKFKMLLTQLCQFYLFWEDKMKLYEPIREERENKRCMEEALARDNEELKIKINQLQCDVNEIAERLGSKDDSQLKLTEMNNKKESYKRERDQVKCKEEKLNNRLQSVIQERSIIPEVIRQLKQQIKPTVLEINALIEKDEQELTNWEEKCSDLVKKKVDLTDRMKAEQVRCKLEERVQASKEVFEQAMHYLDCSRKVLVTQKNTENAKNDILGTEKNIQQKQEVLNMMKSRNEKELWRRQCQLQEINDKYQKKEEHVLDKTKDASVRTLYEREIMLQKMVTQLEEKANVLDNSFLSAVKHLLDHIKKDHEEEKNAMHNIIKNLKK